ncbi:MAG TPA: PH domain-containing protein [Pirellulaceae bacterium]|nr:PH domain-containing protein [Pirellulaceae bacterium]
MNFPAKNDFGTAAAFLTFITLVIGFVAWEFATEGASGAAAIVVGVVVLLTVLLWVWFWFGTSYEITSSHVRIRCGPVRWRVKLNEIVEAVPTSSAWLMVGGSHARFALSKDAILIKASDKVLGFLPHAVLISPGDKPGFLRALAEATPHLQQCDDGSVRCRVEQ